MRKNQHSADSGEHVTSIHPAKISATSASVLASESSAPSQANHVVDPALTDLNRRLAVVRDRARGVALGHSTGFYLFGRGGTGKTYTIRRTLEEVGKPFHYFSGHLTPLGLFELLERQHDRVIVLDDIGDLLRQPVAQQILLAALGRHPNDTGERPIQYGKQGRDERMVRFTGGVIFISNLELHSGPVMQAFKSRVHYLLYDPSEAQMAALIREIAKQGWPADRPKMDAQECMDVAEYLIGECERVDARLDLRLLTDKAFPDYLQHRAGHAETHWKDLISTTLRERLTELTHTPPSRPASREARVEQERRIAREITNEISDPAQQREAWVRRTNKSLRAFQRRRREIGQ